jgi:hypothetical protein
VPGPGVFGVHREDMAIQRLRVIQSSRLVMLERELKRVRDGERWHGESKERRARQKSQAHLRSECVSEFENDELSLCHLFCGALLA